MGSTKTTEQKMPEFQQKFLEGTVIPFAEDFLATEYKPYEGERVAGFTPLQQQAMQGYGALSMGTPMYEQAGQTYSRLADFQMTPMQAATAGTPTTYGGATVADTAAYGGATVERTAGPTSARIGDIQTYGGAEISPIERARAAQLAEAERMRSVGAVRAAQAPSEVSVDKLATTDISQYLSPYQQAVIEAGQEDIERQRQMASEKLAAQAQAAGAFGGSRQAVQEGILAGEATRQAAQLSAEQRQKAFETALESGRFDIGNVQQARTLASQQEMQAQQLGQQAREAAAQREQAARAGNMEAANRFAEQQAQLEQQATLANQSAYNARAQAQAQLTQQAGLASMDALNARTMQQAAFEQQAAMAAASQDAARAAQQAGLTQAAGLQAAQQAAARAAQQAGLTQQAGLSSADALNAAAQAQAARDQAALAATFGGQFQAAGLQQAGAAGLLGTAGQQLQTQLAGLGAQMQAGEAGRMLDQARLDVPYQDYMNAMNYPLTQFGVLTGAAGAIPAGYGTTTTRTGGLGPVLGAVGSLGQTYAMMTNPLASVGTLRF